MPLRIANAAGFLGDWIDAPRRLVERAEVDYLTLEYLAELTLSILARAREKNPQLGYAEDFLQVLRSLIEPLKQQPQLKIVTNAGGMNPLACAAAAAKILDDAGLGGTIVGVVSGDDLLPRLGTLAAFGCRFNNLETDEPIGDLLSLVSANAYLGAQPIAEALRRGARIVITGRVADASLTVGPAMHEFGAAWDDWNLLAGLSVAGHLIECGAQVTGGYSVSFNEHPRMVDIGYPIAEIEADGSCVVTKPGRTDGVVDRRTVVEQLVYEIGDPRHYLTPDVDCDFSTVEIQDLGHDRVRVFGATGRAAPTSYKVSMARRDGYSAAAQLVCWGEGAVAVADEASELVQRRLELLGCKPERWHVELLGRNDALPILEPTYMPLEVVLRMAVHDHRREVVEKFAGLIAPLITNGPAGLAGYAAGRPNVRPVYAYWPTLIPKELVQSVVAVRSAKEWL